MLENSWLQLIGAGDAIKLAISTSRTILASRVYPVCGDMSVQSLLAPLLIAMLCSVALHLYSYESSSWQTAPLDRGKASSDQVKLHQICFPELFAVRHLNE